MPLAKHIKGNYYRLVLSSLFFIASFLYVWLKINPLLYYQNQEPIFYGDSRFFKEFLSYPGGLANYVSSFLSQLYYIPGAGALVVSVIFILISLTTWGILKKLGLRQSTFIAPLIPIAFLLLLHNQYDHKLVVTFSILVVLLFYLLFLTIHIQKFVWRLLVFVFAAIVLHYLTAGPYFLFVLMAALAELVYYRRYRLAILYVIIGASIPWIAAYFLLTRVKDSYLNFLPFQATYSYSVIPYLLYLSFMAVVLWPMLSNRLATGTTKSKLFKWYDHSKKKIPAWLSVTMLMVFLLGGTFLLLNLSFNHYIQKLLLIDYYNRHEQWHKVLKVCEKNVLNNKLTTFHINRALFHTGQLGEQMFAYPQLFGKEGLISSRDFALGSPLDRSDLYFDFGLVNEAEHWAIENVAVKGYTPYNLQRLALVKILKQDREAARKCLLNLKKNFLFKKWANHYLNYLIDTTRVSKDARLMEIRSYMIDKDIIVDLDHPEFDMQRYLEFNKNNRAAFEFLMAYHLLARELVDFIGNLDRLKDLHFRKIPRHYEEAIAVYLSLTKRDQRIAQPKVSMKTFRDFQSFNNILKKYHNDKTAARPEILSKFGSSYWAYLLYHKPE